MSTFDFNSNIKTELIEMPWGMKCWQAVYNEDADARLHGFKAIIVADTLNSSDERLTTMITRFPRCILAEVNTHRVFSRNSASSRARSVKTTIKAVMDDPYVPLFTRNHKGMGGEIITDGVEIENARHYWLDARDDAVKSELRMLVGDTMGEIHAADYERIIDAYYEKIYNIPDSEKEPQYMIAPDVHKQNANRLIEPFMWHEALITSSYWDNFYNLRISDFAQPEIHALACLMRAAQNASKPVHSNVHIPFVSIDEYENGFNDWNELRGVLMDSASECARISYKDRSKTAKSDNKALAERLLHDGHMSPLEHQALSKDYYNDLHDDNVITDDVYHDDGNMHGNLSAGWVQCRHILGN